MNEGAPPIPSPSATAPPVRKRRRWFQFSLRTLLIGTTIFVVASGLLINRINRKIKERATAELLDSLGWELRYDYQLEDRDAEPPGPAWLRNLLGDNFFCEPRQLTAIESIQGGVSDVDADLVRVGDLAGIETLILDYSDASDNGMQALKPLTRLRNLNVARSSVTDEGMEALKDLHSLEELDLTGTRVGDAGVAHLAALGNLQKLSLSDTQITDAALIHLKKLTALRTLIINNTSVSKNGSAEIQRALPNCTVESEAPDDM